MSAVVVAGLGYVGLPLAMRAVAAGHDVIGYDIDVARVKRLEAGESYVEDVTAGELAAALVIGPVPAVGGRRRVRRLRRRRDHGADAAAGRAARPVVHRGGQPDPGPAPAPGRDGDPGVHHLPGHHRGAGAALARGRLRADRRARTSTSATARSGSTRATAPGRSPTRRRSSPASTPARWPRCRPSTTGSWTGPCRCPRRGRPSWPSCSRTPSGTSTSPWSTSWRCSPTTSASTCGRPSTRPPPSRSAIMRFTPGPGRRRALPADRPVLPVVAGGAHARPALPVRRAGQRHQQPHARLRGPPAAARAERARPAGQAGPGSCCSGSPTRRTPATRANRPPSGSPTCCSGWAPTSGRPTRWSPSPRASGPAVARVDATPEEIAAADVVVLLTDHDAFGCADDRPPRPVRARLPPPSAGPNVETL